MNREGVTWSMGATPFIYDMLNTADSTDLDFESLKLYICGGVPPVPGSMVERAASHDVVLCECYGSTEPARISPVRPQGARVGWRLVRCCS